MSVTTTRSTDAAAPHASARPAPALPRGRRTVAAVLIALLLLAAAGTIAAQAVSLFRNGSLLWWDAPAIAERLHATSWQDPAVSAAAAILIAVGLLLFLLALIPARPTLIELREDDPALRTGITRAGLRRGLTGAALRIDGVSSADARVRGGAVVVSAATPLRRSESLPAAITEAVTGRLDQLDPVRTFQVRATVTGQAPDTKATR